MGNTQASNAILAKARAMYGRRLTARNYQELLNCRDLPDLISYLKTRTSYSEALQAANPATTHRAQLETLLRLNLFEQYASLCRYEMNIGHDFYRYFIIRSEVQAITTRLQELHAPDGDVSIYTMPDFIKKHSCLNLNAMSMATSFKMLVLALEGTPYAKILQPFADDPDFALENSGLLELEAALDSFVNSQVEQIASTKLSGKSKEEMLYLLRRQSDLQAIADIYRLKSVLRADRAFIKKRVSLSVSNMTPRGQPERFQHDSPSVGQPYGCPGRTGCHSPAGEHALCFGVLRCEFRLHRRRRAQDRLSLASEKAALFHQPQRGVVLLYLFGRKRAYQHRTYHRGRALRPCPGRYRHPAGRRGRLRGCRNGF